MCHNLLEKTEDFHHSVCPAINECHCLLAFPTHELTRRGGKMKSFIVCSVWELHLYPIHSKPLPFPLFLLMTLSLSPKTIHDHMSYDQHSDCHIFSVCIPYSLIHRLFMFSFIHLNKPSGDEFKHDLSAIDLEMPNTCIHSECENWCRQSGFMMGVTHFLVK